MCRSGRPVRAEEIRDWFGQNWVQHSSPRDGINLVYQERSGGGHVLMKMYKDRKCVDYKGTLLTMPIGHTTSTTTSILHVVYIK